MKDSRSIRILPVIVNIGSTFVYAAICIGIILYSKNHSAVPQNPVIPQNQGHDIAKVLLESLSNSVTIILGIADIIVAAILLWQKKETSKTSIALFTIAFLVFVYFNVFALNYPLSADWIVLIDGLLFAFCASYSFLWGAQGSRNLPQKGKVLGKIAHKNIIAEQLFSYKRTVKGGYAIYTVTSDEHILKSEHDINGILSVTYRLPHEDDITFELIRNTYHNLIDDGNETTRTTLIDTLNLEKDKLTNRLKKIPSADKVTPNDCCLARILVIYLAFLRILDPQPADSGAPEGGRDNGWYGGESYIGELSLEEGKIGLDVEIEQKLFSLLRTGLLGAILVGNESRYIFSYKKNGYKVGRRYSATVLCDSDESPWKKVCMFTLTGIQTNSIPQYITNGIINEEKRVANKLHRIEGV